MDNGTRKKKMRKMLYVYIAIILVLVFSSRTIYNISLPRVTVVMAQSGWITRELEVRGVIEFSETLDIFAMSSGWMEEISVRAGDLIDEGAIIARYAPTSADNAQAVASILTSIERTEHQLERLNITRADIQSRLYGDYSQDWTVTDAMEIFEARQAEFFEALRQSTTGIQAHENPRTQAERDHNRHLAELQQAQSELTAFDDFAYQNSIDEASIALTRRVAELQTAEAVLSEARQSGGATFDERNYQHAINSARTNYQRSVTAYESARRDLDTAWGNMHFLNIEADWTEVSTANASITQARNALESARQSRDDNQAAYEQARDNLQHARNTFNTQNNEQREQAITTAEAQVTQAENAVADATRAYENAIEILNRARNTAVTQAQTRVETALAALEESNWTATQNLAQAEANLIAAYQALNRAEQNQASTQNETRRNLERELQNIDLDITQTLIDLRASQSALTAVSSNSDAIYVTANTQGRIISLEKRAGQFLSQGEIIATIGINNNQFTTQFTATPAEAGFIEVGDQARIYKSGSNIGIAATVSEIRPTGDNLSIRLIAETDQFNGGEFARIRFRKQTGVHNTVVPNESVFAGAMGQHYVWTVQSRQGTLGTEYISVRRNVRIIDSDDSHTAIYMGFFMMDTAVITSHSRELSINGRITRLD
ncbi:MAG: HlyD family efflux transporter periplasmic adaptor subunit [Defluviitaleaceae bacterium]|nr:HlyD family efflux transporter periplasmic adaptor subunit [Defluviitaleaceae bacterium]